MYPVRKRKLNPFWEIIWNDVFVSVVNSVCTPLDKLLKNQSLSTVRGEVADNKSLDQIIYEVVSNDIRETMNEMSSNE